MQRESMEFDVLIVGGGPAGLAAAIRLGQLAGEQPLSICLIEKGRGIGAHLLSGAILDPCSLDMLLPDWRTQNVPDLIPVSSDRTLLLSPQRAWALPSFLVWPGMHNNGLYVCSLGRLCQWLAAQAEALGVEIYPGFAGTEILYGNDGQVCGVATGEMGRNRDGSRGPAFNPGLELRAKYTLFAEGCRGNLGKQLERHFGLRAGCDPQHYSLGFKEVWEIAPEKSRPGEVLHTAGWPLDAGTYGGGFLYHQQDNRVSVGHITGLDYRNPYLSPFDEFQRFKTHPALRAVLEGGRRIAFGARSMTTGGYQSLPRLVFPGGALLGDDAGLLDAARLKGIHTAIESGRLAAQSAWEATTHGRKGDCLDDYPANLQASRTGKALHAARNVKPWMHYGLWLGSAMSWLDQTILRGHAPWTLHYPRPDHASLLPHTRSPAVGYPEPDGILTFDRASSVFLSNTSHEENQPCHLILRDAGIPLNFNRPTFDAPEQRYCPAGVYEIVETSQGARLQINAANCLHCKACDIKDPSQNIDWTPPQGGEGPTYVRL